MMPDIGSLVVHGRRKQIIRAILSVVLIFLGGCDSGEERLNVLVGKFSQQRGNLNEARQLILSLADTEGILGLMVGTEYNDAPDKVWLHHNSPPELVQGIPLKNPEGKQKLDRLRVVARQLACDAVTLDEFGQVRVLMYSGKNVEFGYEFYSHDGAGTKKDGVYVQIPGEEQWVAFRR